VLEVLYHCAKFGEARVSPAAGAAKDVEFFCLSVCLLVTLVNVKVYSAPDFGVYSAPDFAMKALEYRYDFGAVG